MKTNGTGNRARTLPLLRKDKNVMATTFKINPQLDEKNRARLEAKSYSRAYTDVPNTALPATLRDALGVVFKALTGEEIDPSGSTFTVRADANGVPSTLIEKYNLETIYDVAGDLIAKIREGAGPQFLEIATSRWLEHVGPNEDFKLGYRTAEEVTPFREQDEVERMGKLLGDTVREMIDQEIEQEINEAIEFAEASEFPQKEELLKYVYK